MSANLATELSKNCCDGYRNIICICSCIDFLDGLYKLIEETIFYMCVHWTYTMKIYSFTEQNKCQNGAFYSTVLMLYGNGFNSLLQTIRWSIIRKSSKMFISRKELKTYTCTHLHYTYIVLLGTLYISS